MLHILKETSKIGHICFKDIRPEYIASHKLTNKFGKYEESKVPM